MRVVSSTLIVLAMTTLLIDKDRTMLGWDGLPLLLLVVSLAQINVVVWGMTKGAESAS